MQEGRYRGLVAYKQDKYRDRRQDVVQEMEGK